MTDDLRAAIEASVSSCMMLLPMPNAAKIAALTPPMEEPTWPGAPVIAGCSVYAKPRLHTRRNWGLDFSRWECALYCYSTPWDGLVNPRPLTPAECAVHRIPMPCTHTTAEETA